MKLYDFLEVSQRDYDVYDTEYDACVTIVYISEAEEIDEYDKFCRNLIKKVNVVKQTDDYSLIAEWSKFIENNFDKLKEFSKKHWIDSYDNDKEEFVYQWILELNSYVAGYVSSSFYKTLNELLVELV